MEDANRLLNMSLQWEPVDGSDRYFSTAMFPSSTCSLRMNDFPDEPLWTLIVNGVEHHFDDQPVNWRITYRSE
jgi:hypothetical protein